MSGETSLGCPKRDLISMSLAFNHVLHRIPGLAGQCVIEMPPLIKLGSSYQY